MENKPRPCCNERDNGHVNLNIGGNISQMKISKANICPPCPIPADCRGPIASTADYPTPTPRLTYTDERKVKSSRQEKVELIAPDGRIYRHFLKLSACRRWRSQENSQSRALNYCLEMGGNKSAVLFSRIPCNSARLQ